MISPQLRHLLFLLLLPGAIAASGCQQTEPTTAAPQTEASPQTQKPEIMATFLPMYLFTTAVAGEAAQVRILIPPGSEVHEYQSTPADVQAIAKANVLVKNGLGMEQFLESTLQSAQNPQLQVVDASQNIQSLEDTSPVIKTEGASEDHAHDHSHEQNPHVWLDPRLAKQQVANIRDGLIAADPENQATYQANATAYIQQLEALDQEFQQRLQPYANRCTFVTFHDAYPYLANRYQINQVAIVELPEDSLAPADLQRTITAVKQYNVKALFVEPGVDNPLIKSLAQDLNLPVSTIDPIEAGPLDPQYYFTAMRANLQNLESACQ